MSLVMFISTNSVRVTFYLPPFFRCYHPMVLRSKPEAQIIPRTNALLHIQFAPELLCQ